MTARGSAHRRAPRVGFGAAPPAARMGGLLLALTLAVASPRPATARAPLGTPAADSLVAAPGTRDRDRSVIAWSRAAPLADLMYVLRRDPLQLGALEAPLARQALARVPAARVELRRQLAARVLLASAGNAGAKIAALAAEAGFATRPRASVFRVGVVLPDGGDYASIGDAVALGIVAGVAGAGAFPVTLDRRGTGDAEPMRAAAACDSLANGCASLIGEFLSMPTMAASAVARALRVPLVAPVAADESIGNAPGGTFQIGPSGERRGRALAEMVCGRSARRIGVLVSSDRDGSDFVRAFSERATSLGSTIVRRSPLAPHAADLRADIRAMKLAGVELIFWDGEPDVAETLVRQLAEEKWTVPICGGADLDPEHHHAAARAGLEGATFAGDEWRLAPAVQAILAGVLHAHGEESVSRLHVRGYLAGRLVADAVAGGALCAEEIAAALRARAGNADGRGFVPWPAEIATVSVFVVERGAGVPRVP